ncbi:kappa-casein [Sorex araneus]|uniref:kappa-casein n=1 Tax=Sorex araneus TaxID=42254 RepID=UPI0024336E13|nr:kappa-casein [Sorex araneus]
MKSFFLALNILALALAFMLCENEKTNFDQHILKLAPVHYLLNNYFHYMSSYYPHRPVVPMGNQYMFYPFYAKPVVGMPHIQIPQWEILKNMYASSMIRYPSLHQTSMPTAPKNTQDETVIPTTDSTMTMEPTLFPATETTVKTAATSEASSEFFMTSTAETTTASVTSPLA